MGFFDNITSKSFKKAEKGHWIFYPWGSLGKGYMIYVEGTYRKLRNKIIIWHIILLPLLSFVSFALGSSGAIFLGFFVFGLGFCIYALWVNRQCKKFIPINVELTTSERISNKAHEYSLSDLWFFEIILILFIIAGFYLLLVKPQKWLIALVAIILCGLSAIIFAKMIKSKKRQGKENGKKGQHRGQP
jgi:hypothetical protein